MTTKAMTELERQAQELIGKTVTGPADCACGCLTFGDGVVISVQLEIERRPDLGYSAEVRKPCGGSYRASVSLLSEVDTSGSGEWLFLVTQAADRPPFM